MSKSLEDKWRPEVLPYSTRDSDNYHSAIGYLLSRGIPESTIQQLRIHYVDYQTAISDRYSYGELATSPDGLIVFFLSFEEADGKVITAARNFYSTQQSRQQHLAIINRYLTVNGRSPTSKTPKYLVPKGDRNKNYPFYDPFAFLHQDLMEHCQNQTFVLRTLLGLSRQHFRATGFSPPSVSG